jgi:predicted PurR-regulated permease PerM
LFERFTTTTRAVAKGTVAIAILQGALGGIAFAIAGVSAPTLWGVAMTFMAVIPAIGPGIIWLPAGIILLLTGSIWQGVFILIVGGLLVSLIDNLLRPILIGRETKMPDALILLATLGGLATFGISGFIVGPIIAAFFLSLWSIFEEKYHTELSNSK